MTAHFQQTLLLAFLALAIEAAFGYPDWLFRAISHPVSWIGALIGFLEGHLNKASATFQQRKLLGFFALGVTLLASTLAAWLFQIFLPAIAPSSLLTLWLPALAGSSLIAQKSLYTHVKAVATALQENHGTLDSAREKVSHIVGREVKHLDEAGIARAAIESLAENFSDGIIAPCFYLALFGLPGIAAYKAINTADSMIGHKSPRYLAFGFAAAKLDDFVNWPCARMSVLWILIATFFVRKTSSKELCRTVRKDARSHPSPNSGWPESAFAGALRLKLGGPRSYQGQHNEAQWIGTGREDCNATDIFRALKLYIAACMVNAATLAFAAFILIRA